MNLKILQWLVSHRAVLTQVVELAKGFDRSKPLIEQWNTLDKIARVVIPLLSESDIARLLSYDPSDDVQTLALGAEVGTLGIDWKFLVEVLIPLLQVILQALEAFRGGND